METIFFWSGNTPIVNGMNAQQHGTVIANVETCNDVKKLIDELLDDVKQKGGYGSFVLTSFNPIFECGTTNKDN